MERYFNSVNKFFKDKETVKVNTCPICTNTKFKREKITRCPECGFVFRHEQPSQNVLKNFYANSKAMKQWSDIKKNSDEFLRQTLKFSSCWEYINSHDDIYSVLDYGCGNGFFLNGISSKNRIGIEPNVDAKNECSFPVYKDLEEFRNSVHRNIKFDFIALHGVLEHATDINNLLIELNDMLVDSGTINIIVPNVESLVVKTLGYETSTFCPQHLWYFSRHSLALLMAKFGFRFAEIHTIESEIQPILRKLKGYSPYDDIGIELTDKDITEKSILENHMGYKIVSFFVKESNYYGS